MKLLASQYALDLLSGYRPVKVWFFGQCYLICSKGQAIRLNHRLGDVLPRCDNTHAGGLEGPR